MISIFWLLVHYHDEIGGVYRPSVNRAPYEQLFIRDYHFIFLTIPSLTLTSTKSPFLSALVATFVPIMHGIPSSLLTIAACEVMPPSFVIIAFAFLIKGTNSGLVIEVTSISSLLNFSLWGLFTILTLPITFPLPMDATMPFNSSSELDCKEFTRDIIFSAFFPLSKSSPYR